MKLFFLIIVLKLNFSLEKKACFSVTNKHPIKDILFLTNVWKLCEMLHCIKEKSSLEHAEVAWRRKVNQISLQGLFTLLESQF